MSVLRMSDLDLAGQRVFIRADLNVPLDDAGRIGDDTRIRASLAGIRLALQQHAAVMVTSHLGRPQEGPCQPGDTLAPVAERLGRLLDQPVRLIRDWTGGGFTVAPGEVVMLENCRCNPGEKRNSPELAARMARLCDVYVNDAFGTAHRAEATTVGLAEQASLACAGPLVVAELEALTRALQQPRRPLLAIVGGSKVSTKLTILDSLADKVDQLIVGGGIANTFLLAAGMPIGRSLAEPELVAEARRIIDKMHARGAGVPIPEDVVVASEFSAGAEARIRDSRQVADDEMILDIGPRSAAKLAALVEKAGTIVWNGPLGVFEFDAFAGGTRTLAEAIAASDALSIAGGGDTVAAIAKFGIAGRIGYISTAGGAFLEFLEGKKLPAIAALEARSSI